MYVVAQLKDKIKGLLGNIDITKIPDFNGAIERAARSMSQKITIPEAGGRRPYLVYDQVFDNVAPPTIFGGAVVDFRPQGVVRTPWDDTYRQQVMAFDQTKCLLSNGVALTFEWRNGVPIMRVAKTRAPTSTLIDPMDSITGWVAGGHATSLALDSQVYYQSPYALRFSASTSGDSYLEKTLTNTIDLTNYKGVGMVFLALYTPDATDLTSISLRLGSSSANYVLASATQGFVGAWWANDYLLVALDLSQVTTVGTPDFTKMNYVRVTATTTTAINNIRFGRLFVGLGAPYELLFKTAAIFLDSSGNPSSQITSDNDQIILNDAAFTILEHEGAITAYMNSGGSQASGQVAALAGNLNGARTRTGAVIQLGLYDLYRAANPSEALETVGNWYE